MYGIRKVVLNKSGIRHGSDLAFHKYPFLAKLGLKEDEDWGFRDPKSKEISLMSSRESKSIASILFNSD